MANYLENITSLEYCYVLTTKHGNYAVNMSHDGTTVVCEQTAHDPGVYSLDLTSRQTDENISGPVISFYQAKVNNALNIGDISVEQFVAFAINKAHQENLFLPVKGIPKLTKALAKTLSSIQELFVFAKQSKSIDYVCSGYRKPVAQFMESTNHQPIFCSPERLYTVGTFDTRFNQELYAYYNNYIMLLSPSSDRLDKIGLLLTCDWKEHSGWLERTLII